MLHSAAGFWRLLMAPLAALARHVEVAVPGPTASLPPLSRVQSAVLIPDSEETSRELLQ